MCFRLPAGNGLTVSEADQDSRKECDDHILNTHEKLVEARGDKHLGIWYKEKRVDTTIKVTKPEGQQANQPAVKDPVETKDDGK